MIKYIHIKNFESHKDSLIEFNEGMNVITGTTDGGKSGIKRAYEFVAYNIPGGDSFRSTWGGETSVEIGTIEGDVITRIKGTKNLYKLNKQEFTAFKTKVPEEIQKALNLSDLNIQSQFEPHFLLSTTSGKVATHFNKAANLQRIDTSQAKLKSTAAAIKRNLETKKEAKKVLKINLKAFDSLEKYEIELEDLEEQEKELLNQLKSKAKLTSLLTDINRVSLELKEVNKITKFEPTLNEIENKVEALQKAVKKKEVFIAVLDKIKSNGIKAEKLKKLTCLDKSVSDLLELINSKALLVGKNQLLKEVVASISENKESLLNKRKMKDKLELKFKQNMPDVCPICETVLNQ